MNILGISAFYHDSAAALLKDGEIIAAAQEERFTRKKHDHEFPVNAVKYCLAEAGLGPDDLDAVAFYDKPIVKFARILETYMSTAPSGLQSFMMAVPLWMRQKLWTPYQIDKALTQAGIKTPEAMFFPEHHESHAASAFYPSPFQEAAVMTLDGVGEWATSTIGIGEGNDLRIVKDLHFPHSLGLLYSAFTYFTGFRVNSGEYKLMGLAPYGEPTYVDKIYENLLDVKADGSFRLNMEYFGYMDGLRMTNAKFADLFGGPEREAESQITKREMDIAKSIQVVTEEIVLKMANYAHELTGKENLCLAGGVALNCVSNGRLVKESPFKNIWVQPASGDAGGALGCAQMVWHKYYEKPRQADGVNDQMKGSYLGPSFNDDEIGAWVEKKGYVATKLSDEDWAPTIAKILASENVVGLHQGRMEFGPRALGGRSVIGDARSPKMQTIMNLKIKYRESFRPFAPSFLEERTSDFFEFDEPSPYMLMVAPVKKERCIGMEQNTEGKSFQENMLETINQERSDVPAITHVDYSARLQSVSKERNGRYYDLIKAFEEETGFGIIINTSFNVRGEPIVCTPADSYRCFMRTEMDYLVVDSYLFKKTEQPEWEEEGDWRQEYALD